MSVTRVTDDVEEMIHEALENHGWNPRRTRWSEEMLDFEKVAADHLALNLENPTGYYALRLVGALSGVSGWLLACFVD